MTLPKMRRFVISAIKRKANWSAKFGSEYLKACRDAAWLWDENLDLCVIPNVKVLEIRQRWPSPRYVKRELGNRYLTLERTYSICRHMGDIARYFPLKGEDDEVEQVPIYDCATDRIECTWDKRLMQRGIAACPCSDYEVSAGDDKVSYPIVERVRTYPGLKVIDGARCRCRKGVVRTASVRCCGGRISDIPVYECTKKGECTSSPRVPNVAVCPCPAIETGD